MQDLHSQFSIGAIPTCSPVHPLLLRSVPLKGKQGVTGLALCHRWCMTKCQSPLPQEGGMAPKGETTRYILCVALLLQNVFAVHAVRRRRIGASLEKRFRGFRRFKGFRGLWIAASRR